MTRLLKIGEAIDGHSLEAITSGWPPEEFVTMCNSLLFAVIGRNVDSLPTFTERIYVSDRGIDGEWDINIVENNTNLPSPLVTKGWNVFQYKKRNMLTDKREPIISALKSKIKGEIKKLIEKTGRKPDNYDLFLNIDLLADQKHALTDALLEGIAENARPKIQIVGAAELAALLNSVPHIRAAYFVPASFKTWEKANEDHLKSARWISAVELIGREQELETLRALMDDENVHVVIISGAHGIGKTRIAIESSGIRKNDVAVAVEPQSRKIEEYISLCSEKRRIICIIDEPPLNSLRQIVDEALTTNKIQFIITLSDIKKSPYQLFSGDPRVQTIALQPLDNNDSWKLLDKSGFALDLSMKEWIYSQSQGNPGVLIAAASAGEKLRDESDFFTSMGSHFEKRLREESGENALTSARLISLLSNVGVSGRYENEIKTLCGLFSDIKLNTILNELDDLERAGIVERSGSFASVKFTFFANYLASQMIRGGKEKLFALFYALDSSGKVRLIERFCQIKGEEIDVFWDEFFGTDGPMNSLQSALAFSDVLHFLTSSQPERMLRIMESELKDSPVEKRLEINGRERRAIVEALEQLLSRRKTVSSALNLIVLLAEAENENYSNNATDLVSDCFNTFQLQIPLTLYDKLKAFREFTSFQKPQRIRIITIEAAKSAFESGFFFLRHSYGTEPLDSLPDCTYSELFDYMRDIADRLIELADDADIEVSEKALDNLPEMTAELAYKARMADAIDRLRIMAEWIKRNTHNLDITLFVEVLRNVSFFLQDNLDKPNLTREMHEEYSKYLEELNGIKRDLETGSFIIRMKRILGVWNSDDYEVDTESGKKRYQIEVENLASETVENSELLDDSMITWLLSPEAQKSRGFFYNLGKSDTNRKFLSLVQSFSNRTEAQDAFSAYFGGWGETDYKEAETCLLTLSGTDAVSPILFVNTAAWFKPDDILFHRVIGLISKYPQTRNFLKRTLSPNWLLYMSGDQYLDYLRTIIGEKKEHISDAFHSLHSWIQNNRPLELPITDFAWECLDSKPVIKSRNDYWCIDYIASKLAEQDIERGFALLETSVSEFKPGIEEWNPIYPFFESDQFWHTLFKAGKERLLEIMLSSSKKDETVAFYIPWKVKQLLSYNEDKALLISILQRDVESARFIAHMLSRNKEGFWEMAFELLRLYHHDPIVRKNLFIVLEIDETVISESTEEEYKTIQEELAERLKDPSTPPYARSWLQEALTRIDKNVDEFPVWDYDMDQEEFRRHIEDKDSSLHEWAVGRVLKYSDWSDVKKMLSIDDIEQMLPKVDLPEKKRRNIEKALKVWSHDV